MIFHVGTCCGLILEICVNFVDENYEKHTNFEMDISIY
jgi:hypothetical protein